MHILNIIWLKSSIKHLQASAFRGLDCSSILRMKNEFHFGKWKMVSRVNYLHNEYSVYYYIVLPLLMQFLCFYIIQYSVSYDYSSSYSADNPSWETLEIMLFVRFTRGRGRLYRVNYLKYFFSGSLIREREFPGSYETGGSKCVFINVNKKKIGNGLNNNKNCASSFNFVCKRDY